MLVGAVKFRAIDQRAAIVTYHRIGRRGLRSGARFQNLVLQAAGQRNHALFSFIRGQKCVAFRLILIRSLFRFLLLLLAHFGLHLGEHRFRFVFRQARLGTSRSVLQSLSNQTPVHLEGLLFQVRSKSASDVHSQRVAELLFPRGKRSRRHPCLLNRSFRRRACLRSCGCRSRWSRSRRSAWCWGLLRIANSSQQHAGGQ